MMIKFLLLFTLTNTFALPEKFDLRNVNGVTTAKKQAWGTCWAHGTMSSMESALLMETKERTDLAEYYLDKYNGFNRSGEEGDLGKGWYSGQGKDFIGSNIDNLKQGLVVHLGGDYQMAAAALSNFKGVVQEKFTPSIHHNHQSFRNFGNGPDDGILKTKKEYEYYYPSHVEWPLVGLKKEKQRQTLKKLLMKYGAIASAQKINDKPVAKAKDGLEIHLNTTNKKLDHSLSIIGWNDLITYKHHVGAWLIKDSDHRDEKNGKHIGYFYLMYDDLHAGKDELMGAVVFREIKKRKKNEHIYSHALHGWRYQTTEKEIIEVANKFTAKGNEFLTDIGIYSLVPAAKIKLKISSRNKLLHTQEVRPEFAGFHKITLNKKISLVKGQEFLISLNSSGARYAYDASFKMEVLLGKLPPWGEPVDVYSKASKGESFYRLKGSRKWRDFSSYKDRKNGQLNLAHNRENNTANLAINAYTVDK